MADFPTFDHRTFHDSAANRACIGLRFPTVPALSFGPPILYTFDLSNDNHYAVANIDMNEVVDSVLHSGNLAVFGLDIEWRAKKKKGDWTHLSIINATAGPP